MSDIDNPKNLASLADGKSSRDLSQGVARLLERYPSLVASFETVLSLLDQKATRILFIELMADLEREPEQSARDLRWVIDAMSSDEALKSALPPALQANKKDAGVGVALGDFCRLLVEKETRSLFIELASQIKEDPDRITDALRRLVKYQRGKESPESYPLHLVPDVYGHSAYLMNDIREDEVFRELAAAAVQSGRSMLYFDRLFVLYEAVRNISRRFAGEPINAIEIGVFQGGTSHYLCSAFQNLHGNVGRYYAVDTFEGHSVADLPEGKEGSHAPEKFAETSYAAVKDLLSPFAFAQVIQNRIQDATTRISAEVFHFVHLDVDIYEPTLFSLEYFLPRMPVGGIICLDDYNKKTCPGVRAAIDEVLSKTPGVFAGFDTQTAQYIAVKLPGI